MIFRVKTDLFLCDYFLSMVNTTIKETNEHRFDKRELNGYP